MISCWQSDNVQKWDVNAGIATIVTTSNHLSESAPRKHLGVNLLAKNRIWRLVNECTLEEITSRVNKHLEKTQPDDRTCELRD